MKILFLENRSKTKFWVEIADLLIEKGYEVEFLVQNHFYKPKKHKSFSIPYPTKKDLFFSKNNDFFYELSQKDRLAYIFRRPVNHYQYYYDEIKKVILKGGYKFVFGESTLFHELMAIDICRNESIKYLNPTLSRYPNNRFSFLLYDTLQPYEETLSNENLSAYENDEKKLLSKDYHLAYMKARKNRFGFDVRFLKKIKNYQLSLISWLMGERFNTPSPIAKLKINFRTFLLARKWDGLACNQQINLDWNKTLLFPLQLQPEANLDVWGYPYNNQEDLIEFLADNIPSDWTLLIKPNPRVKYELTEGLLNTVSKLENTKLMSTRSSMSDIFDDVCYIFSVTGTVCLEALFSGKRIFSPSFHMVKLFSPETSELSFIKNIEHIKPESNYIQGSGYKYLLDNSYEGTISDPLSMPDCVENDNLQRVFEGFLKVLQDG